MKPEIICMGCQVCCSNTDDYRLELGNQSIRDLILSISPSLTDDRCNSELEVEFKQKKKGQKIVENDRFYGAIMLQERLHKHILVTIEQQRNTGTRRETAALNKRLQFPLYAQTGSHYAWCSLSVTSRWRLERARRTAAEENVLRDFTKPSSFMSCFYRAVCARRQWCIHVGRKQWAECNNTALILIIQDKKRMRLCTPTCQRNCESSTQSAGKNRVNDRPQVCTQRNTNGW